LVTNIAVEVADILGATPTPSLIEQARDAMRAIHRSNLQPIESAIPLWTPGLSRVGYDIEQG
jgi:hypothetical protein